MELVRSMYRDHSSESVHRIFFRKCTAVVRARAAPVVPRKPEPSGVRRTTSAFPKTLDPRLRGDDAAVSNR